MTFDDRIPCVYYHWSKQVIAISTGIKGLGYVLSEPKSAPRYQWQRLVITQERKALTYRYVCNVILEDLALLARTKSNYEIFHEINTSSNTSTNVFDSPTSCFSLRFLVFSQWNITCSSSCTSPTSHEHVPSVICSISR